MIFNMVLHEGTDEEIGVVIASLHSQLQRVTMVSACYSEGLGLQLRVNIFVCGSHIDENRNLVSFISFNQFSSIVLLSSLYTSKITLKCFLTHRTFCWVAYWCQR